MRCPWNEPELHIGIGRSLGVTHHNPQVVRRIEGVGGSLNEQEWARSQAGHHIPGLDVIEVNAVEHLAADVRGLLAEGQTLPPTPPE